MRENEYQQVLDRIVQFRKQMGKTQVDISKDMNLSQAQVCRLESGRNRYQAETLKEFARQGMDIDYVITGEHRRAGAIEILIEQKRCDVLGGTRTADAAYCMAVTGGT